MSRTSNSPIDHPENSSVYVSWIESLNSLKETDPVVGIPVVPPIATVKICSCPYPYPRFVISKSITLEPCPTTILAVALAPFPETEEVL